MKCLELTFEGRESSRVPDVLGEIVPDVGGQSVRKCESVLDLFNQAGALDSFNQVHQWRQINGAERGLMPTGHRTSVSKKTVPSGAEATNVFSVQGYRIGQRLVILEGIHNGKPLAEKRNDMQRRKSITTKIAKEHLSLIHI